MSVSDQHPESSARAAPSPAQPERETLPPTSELTPVDVSVVIGTFNRAEMLTQGLESLAKLNTDGGRITFEVLVIDNASTDHTSAAVEQLKGQMPYRLRLLHEAQQGVASARNLGIANARGEWVAFFDDDQLADPQWMTRLLQMAREKNALVVGGDVQLLYLEPTDRKLSDVCRRLLGEMYGIKEPCRFNRKFIPGTNNLMVHTSVFAKIGVFDVTLTDGGEDADLYRRIRQAGYECWFTPDAVVHHMIPGYRMKDSYMKWTSMRQGNHVAYRELQEWGRWKLFAMTFARTGQAMLSYLPPYLWHLCRGDREAALGARCLLWRSEGYLRRALTLLLPNWISQNSFLEAINFREGRQKLAQGK